MNTIKVFFFSTALSDQIYNNIISNCNVFKPTFSGVGFDRNVGVGLSQISDVTGVSFLPIPSFPKYKKIFEKSTAYTIDNFYCMVPAMFNLPIIKEIWYCISTQKHIKKNLLPNERAVIVICGLYRSLLRPAKKLKKTLNIPVCAIVPDLPELMMTYRKDYSKMRKFLNNLDVNIASKYRECIDGFVLLSKYMNPVINPKGKPSVIVDGLVEVSNFYRKNTIDTSVQFIMYAGKISKTFGVDKLVEAFKKAKLNDVELHLCGDGDYVPDLKNIVAKEKKIKYFGVISHDKILKKETEASLLVEPRPSNNEIVKMSFPSKIIEYMSSGTPVLTTNLPCFDEEYDKYQYRIEDESIDGIASALQYVFSLSSQERLNMGESAKKFILENKTRTVQCKEIFSLIERIVYKR